jgi:hypothetical protein
MVSTPVFETENIGSIPIGRLLNIVKKLEEKKGLIVSII